MKAIYHRLSNTVILLLIAILGMVGCSKEIDNRSYPSLSLAGQFLYNGQPLQIRGTALEDDNLLQLTQTGPGRWDPGFIKVFVREDGSYTSSSFEGNYFLTITPGRGPWLPNRDTLRFSLNGELTKTGLNFSVTPYFWLSNYNFTYNDSLFTATFNLDKIVPAANLERVVVYLSNTSIVDVTSKVTERAFTNIATGPVTVSVNLKTLSASEKTNLAKTGLVYARVGVKTQGVNDLLYSRTVELRRP